jgi:two-component system, sensor histidine kinase and response regulator
VTTATHPIAIPPAGVSAAPARRVFVIDDDDVLLVSCRRILEKDGYEVETFSSGADGLRRLREAPPQLLLVDLRMPGLDGLQVIARVREIDPEVVIAVVTGYATISTAVEAMKAGAYDFLPKPFTPDELRLVANRGHERWRLAAESARLQREKEEAERRFVTFVSHQLKSPVVAAKQYLDVLLFTANDEIPPRAREWLERADSRLDEMLALIHDWLKLARLAHEALPEPDAVSDLGDVVRRVIEASLSPAQAAAVTLECEAPAATFVRGDATSLSAIVTNLVSNGIKYNRAGGRVDVRTRRDGEAVVLEVSDTGIGIPERALLSLFGEFYRVKSEQTRGIPGTGLGLAICRRIVTALGGTIDVRSRLGEGTTFTVRMPAAANPPAPATGEAWTTRHAC